MYDYDELRDIETPIITLGDTRNANDPNHPEITIPTNREGDFEQVRSSESVTIDVGYKGSAQEDYFQTARWYDLRIRSYYWIDDGNGDEDPVTEFSSSIPAELRFLIDRDRPVITSN